MRIWIPTLVLIAFGVPLISFAGPASDYLEDRADTAVRVEVQVPDDLTQEKSIFGRIFEFLGIRRRPAYRPEIGTTFTVNSSAYAPSPYQTDSTPCITAAGTRVRPGVAASNFLPLGTVLEINGRKYIIEDRMAARFEGYFIDIWFPSTSSALEFGRRDLKATVIGYEEPGAAIRATPTPSSRQAEEDAENGGFFATLRELLPFLGARKDVDRFDVDCFGEQEIEQGEQ